MYATLANKGFRNNPTLISKITDKTGQIVYAYQPTPKQVVDEKYTFLISSILSDNKTRAEEFGNTLNISRPAAVKTGTTENFKDAWTLGYTPSVTVGVWVGNNFGQTIDNVAGSLGAAPIWKDLMEKALANTPIEQFSPPDGVIRSTGCITTTGSDPKIASSSAITVLLKVQSRVIVFPLRQLLRLTLRQSRFPVSARSLTPARFRSQLITPPELSRPPFQSLIHPRIKNRITKINRILDPG